jgi:hypothetical protein
MGSGDRDVPLGLVLRFQPTDRVDPFALGIVEKLGGGGMGIVYKPEDLVLRRCVPSQCLDRERCANV